MPTKQLSNSNFEVAANTYDVKLESSELNVKVYDTRTCAGALATKIATQGINNVPETMLQNFAAHIDDAPIR